MNFVYSLLLVWGVGGDPGVVVEDAWIREGPPGQRMLAGYVRLTNTGEDSLELRAAHSEGFAAISMHKSISEDGVSRMFEVKTVTLQAGKPVSFEPGGLHLMLMGPIRPLRAGDSCQIVLEFGNGQELAVEFEVRGL